MLQNKLGRKITLISLVKKCSVQPVASRTNTVPYYILDSHLFFFSWVDSLLKWYIRISYIYMHLVHLKLDWKPIPCFESTPSFHIPSLCLSFIGVEQGVYPPKEASFSLLQGLFTVSHEPHLLRQEEKSLRGNPVTLGILLVFRGVEVSTEGQGSIISGLEVCPFELHGPLLCGH